LLLWRRMATLETALAFVLIFGTLLRILVDPEAR
jgi:hypothetical protein